MNSKKLSVLLVLIAPILLISSAVTINQPITQAFAQKTFSQGWDAGEEKAIKDYNAGKSFNDKCGLGKKSEILYCQGYVIGYRAGWTNAELFGQPLIFLNFFVLCISISYNNSLAIMNQVTSYFIA